MKTGSWGEYLGPGRMRMGRGEVSYIKERRQRVFENSILRRILGPKRDENEEWRRFHNEVPHCRDHVSQPYNTTGNIIVLYILIFKFLERSRTVQTMKSPIIRLRILFSNTLCLRSLMLETSPLPIPIPLGPNYSPQDPVFKYP